MKARVKVRLLGIFRGLSGKSEMLLELEQPTVRKVIQTVAKSLTPDTNRLLIDTELNDPRPNALVLLNGKEINVLNGLETGVEDGDELTIIPVAHGG